MDAIYNSCMHSLSHLKDSVDFTKINWLTLLKCGFVYVACASFAIFVGFLTTSSLQLNIGLFILDCIAPIVATVYLFFGRKLPFSLSLVVAAPLWIFGFCFTPLSIAGVGLFSCHKIMRFIGVPLIAVMALFSGSFIYSHVNYAPFLKMMHQKKMGSKIITQYESRIWSDEFTDSAITIDTPILPGLVFEQPFWEFEAIDPDEIQILDDHHIRYQSEGKPKTYFVD